jgi:diguanylate cyclase (GGDEF)-like protein
MRCLSHLAFLILALLLARPAEANVRYACQAGAMPSATQWQPLPANELIHIVEADFRRGTHCWVWAKAGQDAGVPRALALSGLSQIVVTALPANPASQAAPVVLRTPRRAAIALPPSGEAMARLDIVLPIGGAVRVAVTPLASFQQVALGDAQVLGALLVILFGMGLLGGAFAIALRDRAVGWYAGFALALGVVWSMLNGIAVSPTGLATNHSAVAQALLLISYGVALFCATQFGRTFTQLQEHAPKADRLLGTAAWALLAYTGIGLVPSCYTTVVEYYNLVGLVMFVLLLLPGLLSLRSGSYRAGVVYLVGWLPIVVAWMVLLLLYVPLMPGYPRWVVDFALGLKSLGLLPDWLGSPHARPAALLLQAVIFSLALADRAARLRQGREKAILTDKVTGLPNRMRFILVANQRLDSPRQRNRPLSLVLIDIDRFGTINETLGYEVGDHVLAVTAGRMLQKFGPAAGVARVGGNQFALLHDDSLGAGTLKMLLASLARQTVDVDGQPLDINLSAGAACFPDHGQDADLLMRRAEMALAAARRSKEVARVYHAELEQDRRLQLSLVSALRDAMSRRELQLFLQPKVRRTDGQVTGAEVLLRWHHPQLGLVAPVEFLPFAEQTGLIVELTRWTLEQSLQLAKRLQMQGLRLRLSVNLSAHDLADPALPAHVSEFLMHSRADPKLVCLEITESEIMRDPRLVIASMQALRTLGFELALDDFGTGYSALAYLQAMPVAEVKIDRSFIQQAQRGKRGNALLRALVALCRQLDLRTVAEGVETEAEWCLVADAGCEEVQGYYVSPPLSTDAFAAWLALNQPFVTPAVTA